MPSDAAPASDRPADVVVVGAGPVGLTLAVLLAQRGRTVTVLERWPAPYPLPRAVHLDHEASRIVQSCGLGADLERTTEPAPVYEWVNATGTPLLRIGRIGDSASGWPESLMFHQPTLEGLLARRADELVGLEVRRGVEVTDLDPRDDHVEVRTASGGAVRARWVVGCDGANSTVRSLAGLPVTDLGFAFDWLIVDVVLDHERTFDPPNVQICDPARPTTCVSGGPGRRRFEFMRLPDEDPSHLDDPDRAWTLLAPWDVHPGNARLERHAVYTFGARHAARWRNGRVLIAGDAAHLMPPFAGQGLCNGLRDAANLAWKLDAVVTGAAPDTLLDTYEPERLPAARAAIDLSVQLGEIICVADPEAAAERDAAMAPGVGDRPSAAPEPAGVAGLDGAFTGDGPAVGLPFPQGRSGGERVDDRHGASWRVVLAPGTEAADTDLPRWFSSLGGTIISADADDDVTARWFTGTGASAALVRPDHLVHSTSTGSDGDPVAHLLRHLHHHLAHPTGVPT